MTTNNYMPSFLFSITMCVVRCSCCYMSSMPVSSVPISKHHFTFYISFSRFEMEWICLRRWNLHSQTHETVELGVNLFICGGMVGMTICLEHGIYRNSRLSPGWVVFRSFYVSFLIIVWNNFGLVSITNRIIKIVLTLKIACRSDESRQACSNYYSSPSITVPLDNVATQTEIERRITWFFSYKKIAELGNQCCQMTKF